MQLLKLNSQTFINVDKIVQITITNLSAQRRERKQPTTENNQIIKNWQVAIYLKSTGDNPQRLTFDFSTEQQAKDYVSSTFGSFIISL